MAAPSQPTPPNALAQFGERVIFAIAVFVIFAIALLRLSFHPVAVFVLSDIAAFVALVLGGWRYDP